MFLSIILMLALATAGIHGKLYCYPQAAEVPKDWITLTDPCTKAMVDQVEIELTASMTYLAMAAHFSRDEINRPGFAEYFFKSASEEREHAIKIMDYLLMRGGLTEGLSKVIKSPHALNDTYSWDSGFNALKQALNLETLVTRKIRDIIEVCQNGPENYQGKYFDDYHLVDYLTGDFLTEQYEGQRHLAGLSSELGKLMIAHGPIGEFLFDKKLLNKEV